MEEQLRKMEEYVEQGLDRLTSHPAFLTAVSSVINFNSYRKIWTRRALESLWKDLELPIKSDQEKILRSLQELQIRMRKMQMELQEKDAEIHNLKSFKKSKEKQA